MNITHLERLEAESIQIMREVVAESENPVMLYYVGKDSAAMLHVARKAFFPSPPPFPLLHVDTTWKFQDMYALREKAARDAGMQLIVYKNPEAVDACKTYLEIDGLDAFQVQSTKRQLEEVWQLNEHEYPGSHILPMMTAKFAELGGAGSGVDMSSIDATNLEKVWGDTNYQSLDWLLQAVARTRGVARLGPNMYEGWGSGFLVDGGWIKSLF